MKVSERGTLIVSGSLAQRPFHGGHAWVFMHLVRGLERLGWEVVFVDRLERGMYVDQAGHAVEEPNFNVAYFRRVMSGFGIKHFCLLGPERKALAGMDRIDLLARTRDSAAVIDVMGFLGDPELLDRAPVRVFYDIDPGFWQMWSQNGHEIHWSEHNVHVSIGENIGRSGCGIPTCGIEWITTPQPVVLSEWASSPFQGGTFTSVVSWRGPYDPIQREGKVYGLRVHEFRKFVALPQLCDERFELALDIDPSDARDREMLESTGWMLTDPVEEAGDPWRYQEYIRGSKAEFMVAKNIYVDTCSGWFSDRSLCYLASGRPVLAQDTGLRDRYPTGEGLVVFSTLDEAVEGVNQITTDYARHSRAARGIAEEFFDSDIVLSRLLRRIGIDA
ncbi:MAG: glycosyltransferase [Gammaproteobacteria bacterium]